MTAEERRQAFINGMASLEQMFGFTVVSTVDAEQLGPVLQVRAGAIQIVPVTDWTPPALPSTGEKPGSDTTQEG